MVSLGYLPGSTTYYAFRVSADGSVVVGLSYSASGNQLFRWTAGSGMVGLGYPPGTTTNYTFRVSADASVIAGTSYSASGDQPFRWTAGSGMVSLWQPDPYEQRDLTAINADGSVLGFEDSDGSGTTALVWTAASGFQSLWEELIANGVNPNALSSLDTVSGISADGTTIVGTGTAANDYSFPSEAFVATIPVLIGARPALSVNPSPSTARQLVLSWPTNYTGFTLQSSTDLGSTNWTNCASATVSGASFVVTNSMSAGAQFFRLKR